MAPEGEALPPGRRKRLDDSEVRDRRVTVRLSAQEKSAVAARAAAMNMNVSAYLALRGQQALVGADGGSMSLPQIRAWVAELYALKRILRGSSNNLNQLTKAAHVSGEAADEVVHHAERIGRMEQRLDELLDSVGPELKPRS